MGDNTSEEVMERLRRLQEDIRNFQNGDRSQSKPLPPHLREEIVKIYATYGEGETIAEYTKVPANTIKFWLSKYRHNPHYFEHLNPCARFYRRPPFTAQLNPALFPTPEKVDPKEELKLSQKYKRCKSYDDFKKMLPGDVFDKIMALRKHVYDVVVSGRKKFSLHLKQEVARLVMLAGCARPVAMLLGLNERVLASWRDFLVCELTKVPSAYKLN